MLTVWIPIYQSLVDPNNLLGAILFIATLCLIVHLFKRYCIFAKFYVASLD